MANFFLFGLAIFTVFASLEAYKIRATINGKTTIMEYDEFMKVIKEDGQYIVTMNHIEDSTKTNYKFTFNN